MRPLNILSGALKILLVASLLFADWFVLPMAFRQFQYGDTWVRVYLFTGKTEVLLGAAFAGARAGWHPVVGSKLPQPEAGLGASPGFAPWTMPWTGRRRREGPVADTTVFVLPAPGTK